LGKRQNEVMTVKKRYEIGLEKLQTTEESVQGMQTELIELQPQLAVAAKDTEAAMEVISKESAEADKVKQVVSQEEAVASAEAGKVKAIKDECEGDLAEAMPLLEAALKALDTLTKNDITEVKGMKSPPSGVKLVLEAVCIMRNVKPVRSCLARSLAHSRAPTVWIWIWICLSGRDESEPCFFSL
jgi:dynein heavy chain